MGKTPLSPPWAPAAAALAVLLTSSCSTESYRREADAEALAILQEKQRRVFGEERPFNVEPSQDNPRAALLAEIDKARSAKEDGAVPFTLDLARTLEVAALCSRDFQNQKESLFLAALSLSTTRWEYDWHPTLTGSVGVDGNRRSADASGSVSLGVSRNPLLKYGATMLGTLLHSFSRTITSGGNWSPASLLSIGLTQPLIRGLGSHIVMEELTQAERNVVYSLRSFERFRRRFVVNLTTTYYGLLQQQDRIRIEEANMANLRLSLERQEMMKDAGRTPKTQVDQTRQSLLRSEATLLRLKESLRASLDAFKITLGLPLETDIVLAAKEFEELQKRGMPELKVTLSQATAVALDNRLDLKTSEDEVEDARRAVAIAADALKMGLDLDADVDIPSTSNKSGKPDWKNVTFGGGLSFDIPLDRTRQRNSYRAAIISYERALRDRELQLDSVKRDIRARLRDLRQIRKDHQIQVKSVRLAVARVDETLEKQKLGRAIVRDVLDAQESLVDAQAALSGLLVDYLTARLELLRDLDILKLDPEGLKYDSRLDTYRTAFEPGR